MTRHRRSVIYCQLPIVCAAGRGRRQDSLDRRSPDLIGFGRPSVRVLCAFHETASPSIAFFSLPLFSAHDDGWMMYSADDRMISSHGGFVHGRQTLQTTLLKLCVSSSFVVEFQAALSVHAAILSVGRSKSPFGQSPLPPFSQFLPSLVRSTLVPSFVRSFALS